MKISSRQYLRAPVMRWALYSQDQVLLRGKVINISHGGLLLGELALLPSDRQLELFFELPLFDDFSKINWQLVQWGTYRPATEILFSQIRIVRSYKSDEALDAIFQNVGAEWVNPPDDFLQKVDSYVHNYKSNLRFLLSLFESGHKNSSQSQELILFLSSLLGIERGLSLAHLRTKLMHRYQSVTQL